MHLGSPIGTHPLIQLATAPAAGSGVEELAVVIITAPDVSADDPRVLQVVPHEVRVSVGRAAGGRARGRGCVRRAGAVG